jgi:hypothetical protein
VTGIALSPSSIDDLDPGVTIHVTANITDPSNVSSAVLYYKECPLCNWESRIMDNINGTEWNASFTTNPLGDRNYSYIIWSNDSLGHPGNSTTYNVSIAKDYTWILNNSDAGIESGRINTLGQLGIIAINNTGDDNLSFMLDDDWYLNIYYNGSNGPYTINIGPKNIASINLTGYFEDHDNEKNFTINITATSPAGGGVSPPRRIIPIMMDSYSGGPYFNVNIISPPSTVLQSQAFNLSATVKNIGNDSSNDTWFNWTLPSGWSVIAGNVSKNLTTISAGSTQWSNITVSISPSVASPGTFIIYANATCDLGVNGSASAVVGVSCSNSDGVCGTGCSYVTDSDCSIPPSGGGTGTTLTSIAGVQREYRIEITAPSRFDVNRGENKVMRIGISNPVSGTKLKNVYLSLSGYAQTFIDISPSYIDEIGFGETRYFNVEIKAPIYAVYAEYSLKITAGSRFVEGDKTTVTENGILVPMATHKFVGNETMTYFELANEAISQMSEAGMNTVQINGLASEMNASIDVGNYEKVKELADQAVKLRNSAFSLNTLIKETQYKIESMKSQSINLPESEKMLSLAKSAFFRGDYAKAEERMSSTMMIFAVESGNAGLWIFVKDKWWLLAPVILAVVAGTIMARRRIIIASLNKKLDLLVDEERVIQDLIESAQKEHYIEKKTGAEEYERSMKNFEIGINAIKRKRADNLMKLSQRLKKDDALKKMTEEEKGVRDLIIEHQNLYFRKGKMGKPYYDRIMKGLKSELIEVQRIRETLESDLHV